MVTTNIKETKAGIMNLAANVTAKPQGKKDGDSFQKVFDNQTKSEVDKPKKTEHDPKNHVKKNAGQARKIQEKPSEKADAKPELDEDELEKLEERAGQAAAEILSELSELFGVSMQQLEDLMREKGLNPSDLLSEETLSEFAMEISGAEDAMALLTDGELYGKLQALKDDRRELIESASEAFDLEPEEFLEELQNLKEKADEHLKEKADERMMDGPVAEPQNVQAQVETPAEAESSQEREGDEQEESGGENPNGDDGNMVLQDFLRNGPEQIQGAGEDGRSVQRVDTEMIMRQIMDHMKVTLKPELSSLEMQLHPASLGNVQVQLTSRGGAVTAQFIAQSEAVKAALETQMIQLQESFEEQGIKVEAIEVSVQTRQFEENLDEQGRRRQEQGNASRSRENRRLRIDDALTPEQLDELTQDERIAAEMLQAGGGTIDFTA